MFRRFLALIIGILVCINLLWVQPMKVQGAAENSTIRVLLSSMGAPNKITLKIDGSYGIKELDGSILNKGSYTITIESGQLILNDGTTSYPLGNKFIFKRYQGDNPNQLKIGSYNYLGDMEVRLEGGGIRLVNHVHLETYLYGVVPYEVSNSWPIEAQKAQAVAARTYAVGNKNAGSYFDVHDTVTSQVYRGYDPKYSNSIKAVNETFGRVLKHNGKYAQTFYSASNGGTIEASDNLWSASIPYLKVKDDPYDLKSSVNKYTAWSKSYSKKELDQGLLDRLDFKNELRKSGFQREDIENLEIQELTFKYNNSKRSDNGTIVLSMDIIPKDIPNAYAAPKVFPLPEVSFDEEILPDPETSDPDVSPDVETPADMEVPSDLEVSSDAEPSSDPDVSPDVEAPADTEAPSDLEVSSDAEPSSDPDVSSDAEIPAEPETISDRGISFNRQVLMETKPQILTVTIGFKRGAIRTIFGLNSLLFEVEDRGDTFAFVGKGWGHGIGMSQYGAHGMASQGKGYAEILQFYYSGTNIETLSIEADRGGDTRPTKPVDPKPDPKPNPDTGGDKDQQYGIVNVSSTLNVRQGAGTNYKIMGSLRKGTRVEILDRNAAWYKVKSGNIQGYVHGDYIVLEDKGQTKPQTPEPKPTPPTPVLPPSDNRRYGIVTASSLNIRSGPGTKNNKIGNITKGSKVTILSTQSGWHKISVNGKDGYIHGDYVKLDSPSTPTKPVTPPPGNSISGRATVNASSLNIRRGAGTGHGIIGNVTRDRQVELLEKQGAWYKIKYGNVTGFVHGDYLKVISSGDGDRGPTTERTGIVNASSLNVRTGPGLNYSRSGLLSMGTKVTITEDSGIWYKIKSGSIIGYVSKTYIK